MLATILIFIIILGVLIFVHEFGHFVVAKKSGMKVDEFGFGFPPRMFGIYQVDGKWRWVWGHKNPSATPTTPSRLRRDTPPQQGGEAPRLSQQNFGDSSPDKGEYLAKRGEGVGDETVYSINWIPLGGFVKIRGENNENEDDPRSFINRPFWPRLATLVAGVFMNFVLAWVLMSIGAGIGLPAAISSPNDLPAHARLVNPQIAILEVMPNAPAAKAGLMSGDVILDINHQPFASGEDMSNYVKTHAGQSFLFDVDRDGQKLSVSVQSIANPGPNQGPTGIQLASVGKLVFPWYLAPWEGLKVLYIQTSSFLSGLGQLITGKVSVSNLGGPVKIAQITGQVRAMGFDYLLQFAAFLSINLAILNILPFPALDGGRVLFLIIEKVRRKRNNQVVEQWVNTIGFALLILLMVFVTAHDVFNIFHK